MTAYTLSTLNIILSYFIKLIHSIEVGGNLRHLAPLFNKIELFKNLKKELCWKHDGLHFKHIKHHLKLFHQVNSLDRSWRWILTPSSAAI